MKFTLAVIALAAAKPTWEDLQTSPYSFEQFTEDFNRQYEASEVSERRAIFERNLEKILTHNVDPQWTYKLGVNNFADRTVAEFAAYHNGHKNMDSDSELFQEAPLHTHVPVSDLPASLDWREKGVVTPVKNQGGCGSCWAFSTAETLESHIAIQTKKSPEIYSPQEFVDCAPNPDKCGGTGGCQGSTQWLGFKYAMTAGVVLEKDYPYKASTNKCATSGITPVAKITNYTRLPANNYSALMNAVANIGPIAISAAAEPWQLYDGGVYNGKCGTDVDHAIQLVGYGSGETSGFKKEKIDYWLVRNSWGANWGEKGYIRIARFGETTAGETCATDKTPQDGTACAGGPKTLEVCGLCGIMSDSSYPTGGSA